MLAFAPPNHATVHRWRGLAVGMSFVDADTSTVSFLATTLEGAKPRSQTGGSAATDLAISRRVCDSVHGARGLVSPSAGGRGVPISPRSL